MRQLKEFVFLLLLYIIVRKVQSEEPMKIIGGTNAVPGEFPYHVSLRKSGKHTCGGCLISNKRILTAAHCVHNRSLTDSNYVVATGTIRRDGGELHKISRVFKYPDYQDGFQSSWLHDIAIIELDTEIVPNQFQSPIEVAKIDPVEGTPLKLSGWGWTDRNATRPLILQKTTAYALSLEKCKLEMINGIYDTHFCARHIPNVGGCTGDSGSPLVYNNQLVGIASWVVGCAYNFPDVYTRVTSYLDFIKNPTEYLDLHVPSI